MASEYKKRGGSYNTDPSEKDEGQKNLSNWTEEEWQTKEGSGNAKQKNGTQKRYLPKKAWEQMDEGEREETDSKKLNQSEKGKQFVGNTTKAKDARKNATEKTDDEDQDSESDGEESGEEAEEEEEEEEDGEDQEEDEESENDDDEKAKSGQKRSRGKTANTSNKKRKDDPSNPKAANKKQTGKTMGSKHDIATPPAKQASASRLPKKGQTVTWKAMPGWVEGSVLEIVKSNKQVEGKSIKASKDDPRVVLRSNGPSKKVAVHKPEAIYFD